MQWIIIACMLAVLECMPLAVSTSRLGDIYWNATNPMFRIDNTDHIIDVNKGNIPFEYDQVNIICPSYNKGTDVEDTEKYIIYNVSKEEYDSCRITNPASRIIALCDRPYQMMYFTITFRSFTPQPQGMEFHPGQDYYFISTSGHSTGALGQRVGGRCATHNMKVIFKVCCGQSKALPTRPPVRTLPPTTTTTSTISPSTTEVMTTTSPVSTTSRWNLGFRWNRPTLPPHRRHPPPNIYTSKLPPAKSYDFPREEGKMPNKKTEDRDKLPNETRAKNEELVKSHATKLQLNCLTTAALLLLILYQRFNR